jgi:hypothetical protein
MTDFDKKFKRKFSNRKPKQTYLIFCEWETEKYYFEDIKREIARTITIKCEKLQNKSFKSVAEEIIKAKKNLEDKWNDFDYVFCVFDNNNLEFKDYESWVSIMKKWWIELIYSNKSFEVWFLMHFWPFNKQVSKQGEYEKELKKYLPNKMKKPYQWIFVLINDKLEQAIKNSKKISEKLLKENWWKRFICEPYTDVWKILEKLIIVKKCFK